MNLSFERGPFQILENPFQGRGYRGNNEESLYFRIIKYIFQRGLERNYKNKNVLVLDIEKDDGIIF